MPHDAAITHDASAAPARSSPDAASDHRADGASHRSPPNESFLEDVLRGLVRDPKSIPCKYFYDARGSRLFEAITELDEYYLTRTERAIMERHVHEMVDRLGPGCLLVEYGSGSSVKTRILLEEMDDPAGYVPIDISEEHLEDTARSLRAAFPALEVRPVAADYTQPFALPSIAAERVVVYFPGSTIGNFEPAAARRFMDGMAEVAGPAGGLLIGVDLDKNPAVIEAAYNDREGVTAEFNKNLLRRMNDELEADFDLDRFRHDAVYNRREGRVEMYLVSATEQTVRVAGRPVHFAAGERLLTEYSHKYSIDGFADLASEAGLAVRRVWVDAEGLFSIQYLEAA